MCQKKIEPILVAETICPVCQKGSMDGRTHSFCRSRNKLDGLTSFFHYRGPMRQAIKAIKYQFVTDILNKKSSNIFQKQITNIQLYLPDSILIPIPLHPTRLQYRGFNQAELIARIFSQSLSFPIRTDILVRSLQSKHQAELLHRKERLANMSGVFTLSPSVQSFLKSAILVDDVYTTGATLHDAARVLKHVGISPVWGMTLAR